MPNAGFRITRTSPDRVIDQLIEPMTRLGKGIERRAKLLVPKDTFALNDSIRSETRREGNRVVIEVTAGGGDVDYALYVEYGTSRMRAQPYLRPAMLQSGVSLAGA